MQIRCNHCHRPFALAREAVYETIDSLREQGLNHYSVNCPHCRRANRISLNELLRAAPDWTRESDQGNIKPEIVSEAKPIAKSEAKTEVKPKAKPEATLKAKSEAKPKAKPKATPKVKPEAKSKAKPKTTPKAKSEAKPTAKPKVKPLAKPKAKPEAKPKPK
jgi:phage FluMu protein Com